MPSYIELRRRLWYAVLDIPKAAREELGGKRRFVRSLETDSRSLAERRASTIIAGWKVQIEKVRKAAGGAPHSKLSFEARAWRDAIVEAGDDEAARDVVISLMDDVTEGIALKGVPKKDRERLERGEIEWEDLPGHEDAAMFHGLATGRLAPLTDNLEEFLAASTTIKKEVVRDNVRRDVERMAEEFRYVSDVTRKDIQRWVNKLLASGGRKGDPLTPRTVSRITSACRGYWRYLQSIEVVPENFDPFTNLGLVRKGRHSNIRPEDEREAFTPGDVVQLHRVAVEKRDEQLADLITLAMWTGARRGELCHLMLDKVHDDHIEIVDAKTKAGWRKVPIHPKLQQTVERLAQASTDGYLLSGLAAKNKHGDRGKAVGKRFGHLKAAQGFGGEKVFHSIRKTVATLLQNAHVPEPVSADILGHEKNTMTYGLYSDGATLETKQVAIEKLEYPT